MENLNYMISLKTWEKLKEEDRAVIAGACSKITAISIDLAEKDQQKHLDLLREAGVEVHTYSMDELAPIFAKVSATWGKLSEKLSEELIEEFIKEYAEK